MNTSDKPAISIIALHGNGGGGFRFERSVPHFANHVIFTAPTLPGFAGVPRNPSLKTLSDFADVFRSYVEQQSRPRVVLGTGIGGSIVLEMLQHHPQIADGIILHAPVGTQLNTRLFPRLMRLPGMTGIGQWLFSSRLTRPIFRHLLFHEPLPNDYVTRFFDEYRRCQVFGQMFTIIDANWFESLQPIEVPSALLWGGKEKILSVNQLKDYKTLLNNPHVQVIPDWDHFPMIESPEMFASVVTDLAYKLIKDHPQ